MRLWCWGVFVVALSIAVYVLWPTLGCGPSDARRRVVGRALAMYWNESGHYSQSFSAVAPMLEYESVVIWADDGVELGSSG